MYTFHFDWFSYWKTGSVCKDIITTTDGTFYKWQLCRTLKKIKDSDLYDIQVTLRLRHQPETDQQKNAILQTIFRVELANKNACDTLVARDDNRTFPNVKFLFEFGNVACSDVYPFNKAGLRIRCILAILLDETKINYKHITALIPKSDESKFIGILLNTNYKNRQTIPVCDLNIPYSTYGLEHKDEIVGINEKFIDDITSVPLLIQDVITMDKMVLLVRRYDSSVSINTLISNKAENTLIQVVNNDLLQNMLNGLTDSFSDVCLISSDKVNFSAHTCFLALQSPVFKKMFESNNFKESTDRIITLNDIDSATLKPVLRYIYTETMTSELNSLAAEVLYVTEKYMLSDHIKIRCHDILIASLNMSNAIEMLQLADTYKLKKLYNMAVGIIVTNFSEVREQESWSTLFKTKPFLVDEVYSVISRNSNSAIGFGLN